MLFDGKAIQVGLENEIVHLIFNNKEGSVNVIGSQFIEELPQAYEAVKSSAAKGLLVRSEKDSFIFGADIMEFQGHFKKSHEDLVKWLLGVNTTINAFEDLEIPSVVCINGFALGGGFEVCLMADYRVAGTKASIGLPETSLGIMPGWGGSVRLPRISGADHAIEWITSGKKFKADAGLKIGVIDAVVPEEKLIEAGTKLLNRAISGELDWQSRKIIKKSPLNLDPTEAAMTFETAKGFVAGVAGPNYPAPVAAIKVMQKAAGLEREGAISLEVETFAKLAHTEVAENLVSVFLGDQYLKKVSKKMTKGCENINQSAVLGAGIMGGGIAYQSASKGTPIIMKDITTKALELGQTEATNILGKLVKRKRIDANKMAKTLNMISPTLSYGDFEHVDMVVEAVVENINIKKSVLKELETKVSEDTIIASNTSTINISDLAKDLSRPENFCGMHFFNPVHRMPLVEVIRGEKTSEAAIAKTVQYALQMGKTPIVVNDCPGFLVNRVLFPYFNALNLLIEDGVDYKRIDKVMEKFGWPMGPAYLLDVVGIDTGVHASAIMADAFPDRMKFENESIISKLHKENRLGQKNNIGFYSYALDRRGRIKKSIDNSVDQIINKVVKRNIDITDEEIVERMMLPMIIECARCLEEKIVQTPQEVDMGLLLGLGFPPFRTGALKYADSLGLNKLVESAKKHEALGALYSPTEGMLELAKNDGHYYNL
jgi:3-hydroxyacyl-CoA dehydrogenase/enoyl-CoA hydratase/3-hydroxybutyryl-CoA epimerase/enoyl-CoA isomerase